MNNRRLVFFDGEFTSLTTKGVKFLSMGFVADNGNKLYLEINQNKEIVDPWVFTNVIPFLEGNGITEEEAKERIVQFIKDNYGEEKPVLVADVNQFDWNGICELFGVWNIPFFYIPLDLTGKLLSSKYDIDESREVIAKDLGIDISNFRKHHALSDAIVLKEIWDRLKPIL